MPFIPRWDYEYTGEHLENLKDKRVGIIGTGASAVQIVPELGKTAKSLTVFQRTRHRSGGVTGLQTKLGSAIAARLAGKATRENLAAVEMSPEKRAELDALTPEEKVRGENSTSIT